MDIKEEYFKLYYTHRIHEYSKIDTYKNWNSGEAKKQYNSLNDFYLRELEINLEELQNLNEEFALFNKLYSKYYNKDRNEFFSNPEQLLKWYEEQNDSCHYCKVTQSDLDKIVEKRNGNLTLNQKTKRSKGTLEIEKLDPSKGYTFENSVLACPFCNNAKSNLILDSDWDIHFAPAMKNYIQSLLTN